MKAREPERTADDARSTRFDDDERCTNCGQGVIDDGHVCPAQPPTLHLTAEDHEALGRVVNERIRDGHSTESTAAHVFALGVEAALAAVQSVHLPTALQEMAAEATSPGYVPVSHALVWAARRVVKVPAKEEPAPTTPPALSAEERERLAQVAREVLYRGDIGPWDGALSSVQANWLAVIDAVWTACAKAKAAPVLGREVPDTHTPLVRVDHGDPAPLPPCPVDEEMLAKWRDPLALRHLRTTAWLVDALRARKVVARG